MELIVKAKDIFLEYAGRDILDIEGLEIYSYDRIGLVGDNGAGKTSLLKILSGNLTIADADVRRFGSIALIGQLDELDLDAAQGSGEMLSRLNVAGVAQETMSGGGRHAPRLPPRSPSMQARSLLMSLRVTSTKTASAFSSDNSRHLMEPCSL